MGSAVIVDPEPAWEGSGTGPGGSVGASVGPAPNEGLDEALGLSIGLWPIGFDGDVTDAIPLAGGLEEVRGIGLGVVGHDRSDSDTELSIEAEGFVKEEDRGLSGLAVEDLDMGEPRGVVDGDMCKLPADSSSPLAAIVSDAMTDSLDSAQFLGIEVEELAGKMLLVPNDHRRRIEVLETAQPSLLENSGRRRSRHAKTARDLHSRLLVSAQAKGEPASHSTGSSWRPNGARASIQKTPLPLSFMPLDPLGDRLTGHAKGGCNLLDGTPFHPYSVVDQRSTFRTGSGSTVKVHPEFSLRVGCGSTPQPSPGLLRVNNLLRNHT